MIDIALQYNQAGFYVPFSDEDKERSKCYRHNQVLRAKIKGVQKPRSYEQLKRFFARCRIVADNMDSQHWNTVEKVKNQVKCGLQFFDENGVIVRPTGEVYMPYRSISFDSLPHMEACRFFERADDYLAAMSGISEKDFQRYGRL